MEIKIHQPIAKNSSAELEDIVPLKKALNKLGYYNSPFGFGEYVDAPMFDGIAKFQKDNNLEVDGVMNPGGETESALNRALKYLPAPINDLWQNYQDNKADNTTDGDKYFHCKANHQAASRGLSGQNIATAGSFAKEIYDLCRKGLSDETIRDSLEDLEADHIGWQGGSDKKSLSSTCGRYRVKGINPKY